jgi:hypothetical protein
MKAGRRIFSFALFLVSLASLPQIFAQVAFDRSDFNTGTAPVSSVVYDFDRDGNMDLAVVNSGSNTVSIFLGNGDGTFTPAPDAATGTTPAAIRAGDFNGDGVADLAVLNTGDNTVSILLGNGDGTFTSAGAVFLPGNSLVVNDFNQDGATDLATANGSSILVALGNGDGTFGPPAAYDSGPFSNSYSIASGDFNGDGIPDLAVANCCDPNIAAAPVGKIAVLMGNGDGTFSSPTLLSGGGQISLEAADINNDGAADLVDSYAGCHTPCVGVAVLLSNWDGTFQSGLNVPFNYTARNSAPGALAFGDMDGNGQLDIATTLPGANSVAVFLQKSDGSGYLEDIDFQVGNEPRSVAVADFNNDGRPDIAVTNRGSNSVTILLNADHAVVFLAEFGDYPLQYPVSFGNQQVGTTSGPRTVTLTNTGNIPLLISGITVDGDYSQSNDCGNSVNPGTSCTFNIVFAPTATGQRDGSITIMDNAPDNPQVIRLTGGGMN